MFTLTDVRLEYHADTAVVLESTEHHADADDGSRADIRLEHRHRRADGVPRDGRRSPIPHYVDSADAKTRTTAKTAVT